MLKSFHISNFRLFQKIEVEKLSRVNLVVGKNNAGKSAFIEAVYERQEYEFKYIWQIVSTENMLRELTHN